MTYWTPRTIINKTNLNGVTSIFDPDSIEKDFVDASFTIGNVETSGSDTEGSGVILLEIGTADSPLQYNGHYWRIGLVFDDAKDIVATTSVTSTLYTTAYQIAVNGVVKTSAIMNGGTKNAPGNIEFIIDPTDAATWSPTPLLAGQTVYITLTLYIIDPTVNTIIRCGSTDQMYLYVEDLGPPASQSVTEFVSASNTNLQIEGKTFIIHGATANNFWNDWRGPIDQAQEMGCNTIRLEGWLTAKQGVVNAVTTGTLTSLVANGLLEVDAGAWGYSGGNIAVATSGGIAVLSYSGIFGISGNNVIFLINGIVSGTGSWTVSAGAAVLVNYDDATYWGYVDHILAECSNRGLKVILDLTTFRDWLRLLGVNPYTHDWTDIVTFLSGHRNIVNNRKYGEDPTIIMVEIANEPWPSTDPVASFTSGSLVTFYITVYNLMKLVFVNTMVTNGGLLHYNTGSTGDIDWKSIMAVMDVGTVKIYSSSETTVIPTIAQYMASIDKPYFIDEFGYGQTSNTSASFATNDQTRAGQYYAIYNLARTYDACGTVIFAENQMLYWNVSHPTASYPITSLGAWSPTATYKKLDMVSYASKNWYSLVDDNYGILPISNIALANDPTNVQAWGQLTTTTTVFDVNKYTNLTHDVVKENAPTV